LIAAGDGPCRLAFSPSSLYKRCLSLPPGQQWSAMMKRVATWAFYAVGALAIAYLALYAYAMFSGHPIVPGDPIQIFRRPDAPSYS
jgi:hypothetical protein